MQREAPAIAGASFIVAFTSPQVQLSALQALTLWTAASNSLLKNSLAIAGIARQVRTASCAKSEMGLRRSGGLESSLQAGSDLHSEIRVDHEMLV